MRTSARPRVAVVACALALAACGTQPSDGATTGVEPAAGGRTTPASGPTTTAGTDQSRDIPDGFGTDREVRPVALGDEAWAILERDTFDAGPSVFGESAVVVRVGRAVLVVLHGGHAGCPDGDGQQQVEAMGSQAATSIATMCQFTKTGCT